MTNTNNPSIRAYLNRIGYQPVRDDGHKGMYRAEYRGDRNASLSVDFDRNIWYDHSTGKGGGTVDLVMTAEGCDLREAFNRMRAGNFSPLPTPPPTDQPKKSGLEILDVRPVTNPILQKYLASRGILPETAARYLNEVDFSLNGGRKQFSIGFMNDLGGVEVRNALFKGCAAPKYYTTIPGKNRNAVSVWEGWADTVLFLQDFRVHSDVICLNSTANIGKAIPALERYEKIYLMLDNDAEGDRRTAELLRRFPQAVDRRSEIAAGFKDYAEKVENGIKNLKNK